MNYDADLQEDDDALYDDDYEDDKTISLVDPTREARFRKTKEEFFLIKEQVDVLFER